MTGTTHRSQILSMADKRTVDELSIEELERILAIRKREARQQQLKRMRQTGRVVETGRKEPDPLPWEIPVQPESSSPASSTLQKRKAVPEFEDVTEPGLHSGRHREIGRIWRVFVDRSLLLTEVVAVVGLFVLGFALFNGMSLLQQQSAEAQAAAERFLNASIPTPTPAPQLQLENIVLPSGHTPPQNGVSNFNFDEIPPALRGQIASQVYLPPEVSRPPVTDDTPLKVLIPDLNIDHPIVQGVDWNALQQGVGMLPNGALPRNAGDNVVLAAHNDIYGEIFRDLDVLQPGMRLQIQTNAGIYTYIVRETLIVDPDQVAVMDSQGTPMVTLISCYPYRVNTQRIVVIADRVDA